MNYEVVEDRNIAGAWRVEAINYAADGEAYIAIFTGPLGKERALEYADWKNRRASLALAS